MFVYLLHHAVQPQFKIGKANDIHERIPGIGGARSFNLEASRCILLRTEADAKRVENGLHYFFKRWNVPVDPENRFLGDTEHYEIECFARVVEFLTVNTDLTQGAVPMPVPAAPRALSNDMDSSTSRQQKRAEKQQKRAERQRKRAEKLQREANETHAEMQRAMAVIQRLIIELKEMKLPLFSLFHHSPSFTSTGPVKGIADLFFAAEGTDEEPDRRLRGV